MFAGVRVKPVVVRALCFGAFGAALAWLILRHSLAVYLAVGAPQWALFLNPNQGGAVLELVDKELDPPAQPEGKPAPPLSAKRLRTLREKTQSALLRDPLSARAYRLLGQIAEREGSPKLASAAMLAAARHSLHDGYTSYWLMVKGVENKNYAAAAFYADVLLRSGSTPSNYVYSVLGRMLETRGPANDEVARLLVRKPPWRQNFLESVYGYLENASTPLLLFSSMKESSAPATSSELNAYQWFLYRQKLYQLAYYVWLQFLPPEQIQQAGFLFNGGFDARPSGSPFDWDAPDGTYVTVDFVRKDDADARDLALLVEFGSGRVEFPGVSQVLMLTPGRSYAIRGVYKGDVRGQRGVEWKLSCADGPVLGQSRMFLGLTPEWTGFDFSFKVPETGCPAQSLRLGLAARSPSEQLVSGEIWFDDFTVTPQ